MTIRIIEWSPVFLVLVALGASSVELDTWWPPGVNPMRVNEKAVAYGFDNWSGKTATNYSHTVTNWMATTFSGFTNLEYRVGYTWGSVRQQTFGMTRVRDGMEFSVLTKEFPNILKAHEALIVGISSYRRSVIEDGDKYNIQLGDKWFWLSVSDQNGEAELYFARNNVFVSVNSDGVTNFTECLSLATNLDAQIMQASFK